jgi:release factor glutamine methyltransferase
MESVKGPERGEAFRRGVSLLEEAGIANPALDASVLLGHVTGEDGATALLERNKTLTAGEAALFITLIERRCRRETTSRLTGQKEFYSRVFHTNCDVLDPRPETEILVEKALQYLKNFTGKPRVLDVGTGSGAIAVTLAAENHSVVVTATDICPAALKTAEANSARHGVRDRVRFVRTDLAAGLVDTARFELVVSNPPYVSQAEYRTLTPEVIGSDPAIALVAGPTGMEFYPVLAKTAKNLLKPGGHFLVEVGAGQSRHVKTLLKEAGLGEVKVFPDFSGIPRVVKGTKFNG